MLALVLGVSTLITAAIGLLLLFAVLAVIAYIVNQMAPPEPVRWLIWGIVLLVVLMGALRFFGVSA